jgi:hypothetical protein
MSEKHLMIAGEVKQIAYDAYIYALQQVIFYQTRYTQTQVPEAGNYVGVNKYWFPNDGQPMSPAFTAIIAPNATTLYGLGFLDLQAEPLVLETPEITDRYFSLQLMDQYGMYFLYAGNQFNSTRARSYLVLPHGWEGQLPDDFAAVDIIIAPTRTALANIRIGLRDPQDAAEVKMINRLHAQATITPLSDWIANGRKGVLHVDQPIIPGDYPSFGRMHELLTRQVDRQTAEDYFTYLNLILNDPSMPLVEDSSMEEAMLARLEAIGIRPGKEFDWSALDGATRTGLEEGFKAGFEKVKTTGRSNLVNMNGWGVIKPGGSFRIDWLSRAVLADFGFAGPDSVVSHTGAFAFFDAEGRPLDGEHRYTITFELDNLPPVTEFWSLPIYDKDGYFVANELNRYTINSFLLDKGLLHTEGGKLVVYVQREKPSDPNALKNWLPAPDGPFRFTPRFYGPAYSLANGTYDMPQIIRVN